MPLSSAHRKKIWSARTVKELRAKSLMLNLLDRSWESDWQTNASIEIPVPDFGKNTTPDPEEGVFTESRDRGGDWEDAAVLDQSVKELTRQGGRAASNQINWEDVVEIPWALVERTRNRQAYQLRYDIDTKIYDSVSALPSQTISAGTAGSTYVPVTAPYTATIASGVDHPLMSAIDEFAIAMYRANAIDGEGTPTGSVGRPFMIVHPELIASLRKWLRNLGLSFDPLTQEILSQNPGVAGRGYVGTLSGINIYGWNHLSIPTADSPWPCYAGVAEAVAVAVRPPLIQFFSPQENQVSDNPSWLLRQVADYAYVELVDGFHRKIEIVSDTTAA